MNIEEIREYCLNKPFVTEHFPFDEVTLVFKVAGKMFALLPTDKEDLRINLKCDPERAISLREHYPSIIPGYHMHKATWNTVIVDHSITDAMLTELIDHSYELIVESLTPKKKRELGI